VTYDMMYDIYIIYIDKFHSKHVYVGLAQAHPNYFYHSVLQGKELSS